MNALRQEPQKTVRVKLLGKGVASVPLALFTQLEASIGGRVVLKSHPDYEQLRRPTFNMAIDPFPSAIVMPSDSEDVSQCIKWARNHGIELTVACGRHTVHSSKNDRVTLSLQNMRAVIPIPAQNVVHVQGGARLNDLDRVTGRYNLAAVAGTNYDTGVGGWTIGGGWGFLSRQHGLGVDNLLEVEMVLSNGDIVIANAKHNADLFWAVRGAGANFGVVTRFTFKAHPIESVHGGVMAYPFSAAPAILTLVQETVAQGPRSNVTMAALAYSPGPAGSDKMPIAMLLPIYVGTGTKGDAREDDRKRGRAVLEKQVTAVPNPLFQKVGPLKYHTELQHLLDKVSPAGLKYYEKHLFVKALTADLIQLMLARFHECPHTGAQLIIIPIGGAIGDVTTESSAVASRLKEGFWLISYCSAPNGTDDEYDQARAWAQENARVFEPYRAGLFVNELGGSAGRDIEMESADSSSLMSWSAKDLYGANYDRLIALKKKYDPENFFCNNHNLALGRL
ncbi:FAD-binding domain-containing protein [Gonapodya prolifera JEL478]|uniref:FAD-binding domain-containing protein n=1 Tax=Gonapodya prolifera (strain JEL478) TaxID=1344416 RepID=A0A138ZXD0_GONPJ|nr:FAD-binding domain-containing protein [Gonapodya prolifera JEL478]|eukprot:KXS09157.1 FAD-binding domain-containing protein [Gonapodya prolifera JEL478]